jgi:hypothetical protein
MSIKNKKAIALLLAAISVLTILVSLTGCNVSQEETKGPYHTEFVDTNNIRLMADGPMTYTTNEGASQIITATVSPATATNKNVSWSVAWAEESNLNVGEYVTVTPLNETANRVKITCFQPFEGNIIVTVTTQEGNYSAECVVSFVGLPTFINVESEAIFSEDAFRLGIGQSYTFNLTLTNPFNYIGADYTDLEISVKGIGSVILSTYEYYTQTGNSKWYDTSDKQFTVDELKDNFITATIENGVLTITTLRSVEGYYESMQRIDGGRTHAYTNKFRSIVDDCFFVIYITEPNSGLTSLFRVRLDETVVTGVESQEQLYF